MQQPQRSRKGDRVTRIVFTLNNWTQEEWDYLTTVFAPGVQWIIIGKETGKNGTPHLQGACILGTRMAFSKLKTLTGFKRAHVEPMFGKPEDSLQYCSKSDSQPFVCGTLPTPGKRSDIHNAVARVRGGENLKKLAADDEGGVAIVKFHKGLTVLRSLIRPPRTSAPYVFWIWGPTGLGKTRCSYKSGRELARRSGMPPDDIWISSGGLRWFDGYDGQMVAIFDDFRAKHVTSFAFFLRLLDRYPVSCEFKGGFVSWTPRYIFITCPYSPERCFEKRKEHVPEDIEQLNRRISLVHEMSDRDGSSKADRALFVVSILSVCGLSALPEPSTADPLHGEGSDLVKPGAVEQPQAGGGDDLLGGSSSESDESWGSSLNLH